MDAIPRALPRAVVRVEAIGIPPLHGRPFRPVRRVLARLGAMGSLGMARRCARLSIVVDAQGFYAISGLFLSQSRISLCLDLCFALAICRLGFLEDVDDVLALRAVSNPAYRVVSPYRRRTLLTTLPDLLMTVMVSPTPIAVVQWVCLQLHCGQERSRATCDGCGVVLDLQSSEAVRMYQSAGSDRIGSVLAGALHKVLLDHQLGAALRQGLYELVQRRNCRLHVRSEAAFYEPSEAGMMPTARRQGPAVPVTALPADTVS